MAQLQRVVIAPSQLQNQRIVLTVEQQHYLSTVLRLQQGDRFIAMNGQGQWWLAELQAELVAQVLQVINAQTELPASITLMAALPKGNGFDEVVRQATELGVACIIPILSQRTLLNPSTQKLARWRRIAQEAAEQAERQIVPSVLDPITFSDLQQRSQTQSNQPLQRYLCVAHRADPHLLDCLRVAPRSEIWIATGPEGGWTAAEVEQAIAVGYQPVSLGRRILRAATAPLTALALVAASLEYNYGL